MTARSLAYITVMALLACIAAGAYAEKVMAQRDRDHAALMIGLAECGTEVK